jgi:hypothetical protein
LIWIQAQLVGTELNRTALSFAERWKTAIEKVEIRFIACCPAFAEF